MAALTKSWKTTLAGIAAILTVVGAAVTQYVQGGVAAISWEALIAGVLAGVGLILAKDSGVSNAPVPGPAVKVPPPA
jgi:hypothetical protein